MSQPVRYRGKELRPNILDRVVEFVSPQRALARLQARAKMAVAGQWLGGRSDRRATSGWKPISGDADADTLFDLPTMRDRSRDLVRNNPLALGAVNTVTTTVIGTGLALSANPDGEYLGLNPEETRLLKEAMQREFSYWAGSASESDASRTLTFYAQQELAFRSALESGDVFALLPMKARTGCIYETRVRLIEADRCNNKDNVRDTSALAGGIATDTDGAPTDYHFMKTHPGNIDGLKGAEWVVVPAFGPKTGRRNVIHLFDKRRPDQRRGIPYLAPVIESLKQLGDYSEAEITAAVVSGMFTVFINTESGEGLDTGDSSNSAAGSDVKMGYGAIIDLAKGEQVSTANPGRPNAAFDPFVQAILRQVGVALELPFELLIKHFTSSYTAARAAILEAWRFFRKRRTWVADMYCQPIYEAVMEEAAARGRIDLPGFFDDPAIRAAYLRSDWIGDAPGQLDELKEVQAARERIEGRLSNHEIEAMKMQGLEWGPMHAKLAEELKTSREMGTEPAPKVPAVGAAAPAPDAETTDDDLEGDKKRPAKLPK